MLLKKLFRSVDFDSATNTLRLIFLSVVEIIVRKNTRRCVDTNREFLQNFS
jgi:hypothetical protein